MKMMVILAVLFVSLLVLTGAAFGCIEDYCYKVTGNDLTNPANSFTQDWLFCYEGDNEDYVYTESGPTPLFGASFFGTQAISFESVPGAYMTFHGLHRGTFDGLYYDGAHQYTIHGVEEECTL